MLTSVRRCRCPTWREDGLPGLCICCVGPEESVVRTQVCMSTR